MSAPNTMTLAEAARRCMRGDGAPFHTAASDEDRAALQAERDRLRAKYGSIIPLDFTVLR